MIVGIGWIDMTRLFSGTPFDIPPQCDRCGKLEQECECQPTADEPERIAPQKQTARVRVDRRKHKRMVTVVWGLHPCESDLPDLLSQLKSACGAGGSIQDDQIEIQGDHGEKVRRLLGQLGYRVK